MFHVTGHQIKCEGLQIEIIIHKLGPTFVQQYWWSVLCGSECSYIAFPGCGPCCAFLSELQPTDQCISRLSAAHFPVSWCPLHVPTTGAQATNPPLRCAVRLLAGRSHKCPSLKVFAVLKKKK